jgi:hypothetical protein
VFGPTEFFLCSEFLEQAIYPIQLATNCESHGGRSRIGNQPTLLAEIINRAAAVLELIAND